MVPKERGDDFGYGGGGGVVVEVTVVVLCGVAGGKGEREKRWCEVEDVMDMEARFRFISIRF